MQGQNIVLISFEDIKMFTTFLYSYLRYSAKCREMLENQLRRIGLELLTNTWYSSPFKWDFSQQQKIHP